MATQTIQKMNIRILCFMMAVKVKLMVYFLSEKCKTHTICIFKSSYRLKYRTNITFTFTHLIKKIEW